MFEEFKDVLTVEELCKALRIGKSTAFQLLRSGEIKAVKVNRQWRIPKINIIKYLGQ